MRAVFRNAMLMVACMMLVGGTVRAFAEDTLVADVPFKFVVSGRTYDAGRYDFRLSGDEETMELEGSKTGAFKEVMTRLSGSGAPASHGHLVFDKVGETYYLSEVWESGQDGFLLYAPSEQHTHHTVALRRR